MFDLLSNTVKVNKSQVFLNTLGGQGSNIYFKKKMGRT